MIFQNCNKQRWPAGVYVFQLTLSVPCFPGPFAYLFLFPTARSPRECYVQSWKDKYKWGLRGPNFFSLSFLILEASAILTLKKKKIKKSLGHKVTMSWARLYKDHIQQAPHQELSLKKNYFIIKTIQGRKTNKWYTLRKRHDQLYATGLHFLHTPRIFPVNSA